MATTDADSLPEQLVRTRRFTLGHPRRFTVSADGGTVLFLRSRAGDDPVACLWALDVGTGVERVLADPAQLCGGTAGQGIASYAADESGASAAFTMAGGLWVVDVGGGRARQLPAVGPVVDPRPDPAGRRVAYTAGGALRVIEADGTGDRAVAEPDGPDVEFGAREHTADVAPGDPRGFWWAPGGDRLLVARVDSARVPLRQLGAPAGPGARPRAVRYTAPGEPCAEVTLWVACLDGTRTRVDVDPAEFPYLAGAGWDRHGPFAAVQSRTHDRLRTVGIDPADGRTAVLAEQHDAPWVHLVPGLPARTSSGAILAHQDAGGTRFLTVDGMRITPPGLQLRAVLGADGGDVLFTASDDPAQTHLWQWQARTGRLRRLSGTPGVHSGARRGGTLLLFADGVRPHGRATVVRDRQPPRHVASVAEHPATRPRVTRLELGPRALRADLYLPSWHGTGSGPLPVLLDPYGGPGRQRVTAAPDWRVPLSQWFAEQGFAVLVADGRGTPGRGPDWERAVHGDLFGPVLDDQVTALREAAARCPDLDLGRVGIRGSSFGGTLAALAVLRRPDCFHAGVAASGVTDPRLYHARSRERFLGLPDAFPERYDAGALAPDANGPARPLLLVHGLDDANVPASHTRRLSAALLAAGHPHEVLLLRGVGHQVLGAVTTGYLLQRQRDFLQRHLGVDAARAGGGPR
ncbi:prolyl oligopeptidase family serine peptidase [Streptomyces sp. NPDC020917]|uniref:S9 family peptidase n=1 Tax=Streptomyces sp. NPDC020917 TaxID=3365102 RepID=UPI0037A2D923